MKTGTGKRIAQRLGLMGFGLVLALVLTEGLCKFIDVKSAASHLEATKRLSRLSEDPDIRYELIPNVEGITPGQQVSVRVNNLGFRGRNVSVRKPVGTFRIAVVGDSIAFGRTYPEEQVFPSVLESMLNQSGTDLNFEVINAALSGRDTWEEAAVIERRILPLDPDLVILQICMNDHVRLPKPTQHEGMFGERAWYSYSSLLKLLDRRSPGFRSKHVAGLKLLGLDHRSREEVMLDQRVPVSVAAEAQLNWPRWSEELLRIATMTRNHGSRILYVVFPLDLQIYNGQTATLPELDQLGNEHEIPVLDMITFYRGRPKDMLIDYTHPTPKGHYVAGHEIAAVILQGLALEAAGE